MPESSSPFLALILVTAIASPLMGQEPSTPAAHDPPPPERILGVLPNFGTLGPGANVPPSTTAQRFRIASRNTFDPFVYPFVAFTAGLADIQGHVPTWGGGAAGYAKRYAASFADNALGNLMTTAVVPTLVRQDPRYFMLGTGGFWHRAAYAASRSLVTGRGEHLQFNVSEIGGNLLGAGLSDLYYPGKDRSLAATLQRGRRRSCGTRCPTS